MSDRHDPMTVVAFFLYVLGLPIALRLAVEYDWISRRSAWAIGGFVIALAVIWMIRNQRWR